MGWLYCACPENLTLFGFVAYIHCLCSTGHSAHIPGSQCYCSQHINRYKTFLMCSNRYVHATWHIHIRPWPGLNQKPSFYGAEALGKYWLWNNQIGRKLVLGLKKRSKRGAYAAITALREHFLFWGCKEYGALQACTWTGPAIASSLWTFVWQRLYEKKNRFVPSTYSTCHRGFTRAVLIYRVWSVNGTLSRASLRSQARSRTDRNLVRQIILNNSL